MRADPSPSSTRSAARRRAIVRASCGLLLLAVGANALSLPGRRFVGRYDFGYAIRGDKDARPAQVFDDGDGKVYFEARPNQPMPAVFVGQARALLVMQPEGQYFSARTTEGEFTLVLGAAQATVRRGGSPLGDETSTLPDAGGRLLASAEGGLTPGVDYGPTPRDPVGRRVVHEQPVVFGRGSSRLAPEVLDALSALAVRIGRGASITVTGRNDPGGRDGLAMLRAEALRNALLARGVDAHDVTLSVDDAPPGEVAPAASTLRWRSVVQGAEAPVAPAFDIAPADGDIAFALRRWAQASGYEVIWDVDWVAPVNGSMHVDAPSFMDAVTQVVAGLRAQGYPVQARAYSDRVVRFTATH